MSKILVQPCNNPHIPRCRVRDHSQVTGRSTSWRSLRGSSLNLDVMFKVKQAVLHSDTGVQFHIHCWNMVLHLYIPEFPSGRTNTSSNRWNPSVSASVSNTTNCNKWHDAVMMCQFPSPPSFYYDSPERRMFWRQQLRTLGGDASTWHAVIQCATWHVSGLVYRVAHPATPT